MNTHIDKLLSIAGSSLIASPPFLSPRVISLASNLAEQLLYLLSGKNGFYAFESALHVFPASASQDSGVMDLDCWNDVSLWIRNYDFLNSESLFFAEDVFGGQFCMHHNGIYSFDPETGDLQKVATDLDDWSRLVLEDYEFLTGSPLAHDWQVLHGSISNSKRLLPKTPFVCGGEYSVQNLRLTDAVEGMRYRADFARQIRSLLDGTNIRLVVE